MRYIRLGVAVFVVLSLTIGIALLTTGGIIAGSANTKKAEIKYWEYIYELDVEKADKEYTSAVEAAEQKYKSDLADSVPPAAASETYNAAKDAASAVRTAAEDKAKQDYDLAVLNVKRNYNDGEKFFGTYRVADTLTTVRTTLNTDSNGLYKETYEKVLTPAGKLLVTGMILSLTGLFLGMGVMLEYLGVFERIKTAAQSPKKEKPVKEKPVKEKPAEKTIEKPAEKSAEENNLPVAQTASALEVTAPAEVPASKAGSEQAKTADVSVPKKPVPEKTAAPEKPAPEQTAAPKEPAPEQTAAPKEHVPEQTAAPKESAPEQPDVPEKPANDPVAANVDDIGQPEPVPPAENQ